MTLNEKKKFLKGRRIVEVKWNSFKTGRSVGRGQGWTTDPVFILDDGSKVGFSVQETEVGEYGISVNIRPKDKNMGSGDRNRISPAKAGEAGAAVL